MALAPRWAPSDPISAAGWINRLSATERDAAIHAVAGSLVESDPEGAVKCAMEIGDETLRNRQAERAARVWLEKDPLTARNWIRSSRLEASRKPQLLSQPGS